MRWTIASYHACARILLHPVVPVEAEFGIVAFLVGRGDAETGKRDPLARGDIDRVQLAVLVTIDDETK